VRRLLSNPLVRLVDLPPQPDLDVAPLLDATIEDLGIIEPPDADAPLVAILDTGVNSAHPLLEPVVIDRAASPATLGPNDIFGHGSRVSGIAAYGDVRDRLENGNFQSMEFACPFWSISEGKALFQGAVSTRWWRRVDIFFGAIAEANIRRQKMHRHSTGQSDCLLEDAVSIRSEALRVGSA
jgi:hypothetical protein